ncbi:MAG: orotidine-5-phosphate decarboxylase [Pseudomonadota bacterium]|nr:orotidine-5-phosphate decarboxylase [Pseudomonadota bacterium]
MNPLNPVSLENQANFESPIIIALDYTSEAEVMNLIQQLDPSLCKLKVGKELFTACGPKLVEKLVISGYKVFLDLKFHDIPNTVYRACKVGCNLGVWMLNVHASGGIRMLEQAKLAVDESNSDTLLIAVTVLTSMNQADLAQTGINEDIKTHILNLAQQSYHAGLDGVVCSAQEAAHIKHATSPDFIIVTPGIRLNDDVTTDDQQRIMTPKKAIQNLADYLVIGRPITEADDPREQLLAILSSIKSIKSV